jgi:hypothetical protein
MLLKQIEESPKQASSGPMASFQAMARSQKLCALPLQQGRYRADRPLPRSPGTFSVEGSYGLEVFPERASTHFDAHQHSHWFSDEVRRVFSVELESRWLPSVPHSFRIVELRQLGSELESGKDCADSSELTKLD